MKKQLLLGCLPFFCLFLIMLFIMAASIENGIDGDAVEGDGQFIFPKAGSIIVTSVFGNRIHPVDGINKNHDGIDIAAGFGEAVLASAPGTVVVAGWHYSYGNYVIIDHGDGYKTLYAHMSQLGVYTGDLVDQSARIGAAGSTGVTTGIHIHFEIWLDGERIDPLTFFAEDTYTYK